MAELAESNDINVVFSFFILTILNNYFDNNSKLFTKIIFQILVVLVAADLIWFFVMSAVWGQTVKNTYWEGQGTLQILALILCWVEIALKGILGYYLFLNFKDKYPTEMSLLFNLN